MVDRETLEAIGKMMEAHTVKIELMIENDVTRRLNLLEEGQQSILEKLVPRARVDELEDEVKFLKSMVRRMDEELQALKKAN